MFILEQWESGKTEAWNENFIEKRPSSLSTRESTRLCRVFRDYVGHSSEIA